MKRAMSSQLLDTALYGHNEAWPRGTQGVGRPEQETKGQIFSFWMRFPGGRRGSITYLDWWKFYSRSNSCKENQGRLVGFRHISTSLCNLVGPQFPRAWEETPVNWGQALKWGKTKDMGLNFSLRQELIPPPNSSRNAKIMNPQKQTHQLPAADNHGAVALPQQKMPKQHRLMLFPLQSEK